MHHTLSCVSTISAITLPCLVDLTGIFTVTIPGIYDISLTVFSGTTVDLKMYIMLERDGNISRSV